MSLDSKAAVIRAVKKASSAWVAAFNRGDASGCAGAYEANAVMNASPFGTFRGHGEIEAFWAQLIAGGYSDVEYIEPRIDVIDDTSAVLSARWSMNKAHGVITKELWVLQDDGEAKLREDDFEAQG